MVRNEWDYEKDTHTKNNFIKKHSNTHSTDVSFSWSGEGLHWSTVLGWGPAFIGSTGTLTVLLKMILKTLTVEWSIRKKRWCYKRQLFIKNTDCRGDSFSREGDGMWLGLKTLGTVGLLAMVGFFRGLIITGWIGTLTIEFKKFWMVPYNWIGNWKIYETHSE